jgi:hypothetical protein
MTKRKRGRPRKDHWDQRKWTVLSVLSLSRRKGWEKIEAAVLKVAEQERISPRTVWSRWADPDYRLWANLTLEKHEYDAMLDLAHEAAWEEARESLAAEHGEREFTDEEIESRIEELVPATFVSRWSRPQQDAPPR